MSGLEATIKSIPIPTFDGKDESFELFWPKFKAYANLKGFSAAIKRTSESNMSAGENVFSSDADTAKREKAAQDRNSLAIATFTISFQTVTLMNRIDQAKTMTFPGGLAVIVVDGLLTVYPNLNV